jgi:DNA-binding PadR family transcriptional regulator
MIDRLGLWEIAILALLREEPMHPYQMQRLLRERHKDEVLVLKRGSLYHAIQRLLRANLIEAVSSGRHGRRPERTTYRICAEGRQTLDRSLREMIAVPQREVSEFLGSMSFLLFLTPDVAAAKLGERVKRLENEIHATEGAMKAAAARVQRINLIETEYLLAMRKAELKWVRGVADELHSGHLSWDLQEIFKHIRAARRAAAVRSQAVRRKKNAKS